MIDLLFVISYAATVLSKEKQKIYESVSEHKARRSNLLPTVASLFCQSAGVPTLNISTARGSTAEGRRNNQRRTFDITGAQA